MALLKITFASGAVRWIPEDGKLKVPRSPKGVAIALDKAAHGRLEEVKAEKIGAGDWIYLCPDGTHAVEVASVEEV